MNNIENTLYNNPAAFTLMHALNDIMHNAECQGLADTYEMQEIRKLRQRVETKYNYFLNSYKK
jgi:hypothetical protein